MTLVLHVVELFRGLIIKLLQLMLDGLQTEPFLVNEIHIVKIIKHRYALFIDKMDIGQNLT